jgi:hypothetical protein
MPTKSQETTPETHNHLHDHCEQRYYSELARISAGLFVGTLALMVFLLTAGLQHPQKPFSFFVYASIVLLPVGLLLYILGHNIHRKLATDAKPDHARKVQKWLKITHFFQQALFVLSIIAVTGLALVSAHIFFTPAPSSGSASAPTEAQ